jgi:tetratricopeptide (TPR) repeat protein
MDRVLQRDQSAVAWRRRWWTRRVTVASALLVAGAVAALVVVRARRRDCAAASRLDTDATAVVVCQREYQRTRLPRTGAVLADAYRRSGNVEAAVALATELLDSEARGNALQILGKLASGRGRYDESARLLQEARTVHRAQGDRLGLARDDQALGNVQRQLAQYSEALQTLDEAIAEAVAVDDPMLEGYCHLTVARVLTEVGYVEVAGQAIDRARRLLTADRDLAQLYFMQGNLEQNSDRGMLRSSHQHQAVVAFEHSLELARRSQMTGLALSVHLNLAYSLAEIGRVDAAERHLADAALLDRDRGNELQRAVLAARIAYRRGNLTLAYSSISERQYAAIEDPDEQIEVSVMLARIALAIGDLGGAVTWATRGVDVAEEIRHKQVLSELRPWVLASRRAPFELLFAAHAHAGRIEDAAAVFDRWQGRTLLDEMARPSSEPASGLASTASMVQSLRQWLPAASAAPLMTSDPRALHDTLARLDLIALVVAEGEVWRLSAVRGHPALDRLGTLDELRVRIDRFAAKPTDAALADELGALIVPADAIRTTDDPLYVVLDALLAEIPFVALRRDHQPVIAARPVIRAPRIPIAGTCGPRAPVEAAVVLADAAGDLRAARAESGAVASRFGTTPLVGSAATSGALLAAKSAALLHIAVHAEFNAGGGILRMYDRAVSAPEIAATRLGPSLVVLAGCSTARSPDPELAASLATAFLAGGSRHAIGTLAHVSDEGAEPLIRRFYDLGGAEDPVRALARVQAELARGGGKDWPFFTVFSTEACLPRQ